MNCNKCGKPNDLDSKFCVYCGNSFIEKVNYSKGKLVPFQKNEKWGYKDNDTRDIIVPPKYSEAKTFFNNRAIVSLNNKYAIIDQNGKELTPFKFDFISDFENGFAKVKRDEKWTFINTSCNLVFPFQYNSITKSENGYSKAEINNKYVLLDFKGNKITQIEYDKISTFINDFARVENNSKIGLINREGKEILRCEYDSISNFNKGIAILKNSEKYGLINSLGNVILECLYDEVEIIGKNSIKVRLLEKWFCFDSNGNDTTLSDNTFKKIKNREKRSKKITWIISLFLILLLLTIYDYNTKTIGAVRLVQNLIYGEDELDWEEAYNKYSINNLTPLKEYLVKQPNGKHRSYALKSIERSIWSKLNTIGKISSYQNYLNQYPNGEFSKKANSRIREIKTLKEKKDWGNYLKENSINGYNKYLKKYPSGGFVKIAKRKIDWINIDLKAHVYGYSGFIDKYPNTEESKKAKSILYKKGDKETYSLPNQAESRWGYDNEGIYSKLNGGLIILFDHKVNLFEYESHYTTSAKIENERYEIISKFKGSVFVHDKILNLYYVLWKPKWKYAWVTKMKFKSNSIIQFVDGDEDKYEIDLVSNRINKIK